MTTVAEILRQPFWLTATEVAVVEVLLSATSKTGPELHDLIEAHTGEILGEGPRKFSLARLVQVGILDSHPGCHGGYSLTAAFRRHLMVLGFTAPAGVC